ncbi:hypothetical protein OAK51_07705 [Alphaproteobacteria bacterium]|nr:hypothetical protein [Alphaproteobacteria bacterium]
MNKIQKISKLLTDLNIDFKLVGKCIRFGFTSGMLKGSLAKGKN